MRQVRFVDHQLRDPMPKLVRDVVPNLSQPQSSVLVDLWPCVEVAVIRTSPESYAEPEILSSSIHAVCVRTADVENFGFL